MKNIAAVAINEALAAQVLAVMAHLELGAGKVNL